MLDESHIYCTCCETGPYGAQEMKQYALHLYNDLSTNSPSTMLSANWQPTLEDVGWPGQYQLPTQCESFPNAANLIKLSEELGVITCEPDIGSLTYKSKSQEIPKEEKHNYFLIMQIKKSKKNRFHIIYNILCLY